jgi:hypothetical protein
MRDKKFKNHLIAIGLFLTLMGGVTAFDRAPGVLEGHLKIISVKTVELADGGPATPTIEDYVEYPLIVLSVDGKREIARVTADKNGNYRLPLSPGDYLLDVHGREPGRVRAKPQAFKVISNETVRVDMELDTGIR